MGPQRALSNEREGHEIVPGVGRQRHEADPGGGRETVVVEQEVYEEDRGRGLQSAAASARQGAVLLLDPRA